MLKKIVSIGTSFLAAGYLVWAAVASSATREFCTDVAGRCVTVHGWWVDVPIMRSDMSLVIYKRGLFSSREEIMSVEFFDEGTRILKAFAESIENKRSFGWGSAYDLNLGTPPMVKLKVASIFSGKVYVPPHRALITCNDFGCLDDIKSIRSSR